MHQTTVRFSPDLWEALEIACASLGVSAAQYLREAALARLAFTAGRTGGTAYASALVAAGAPALTTAPGAPSMPIEWLGAPSGDGAPVPFDAGEFAGALAERAEPVLELSGEEWHDADALGAQSRLVRQRARVIRAESERLRRDRAGPGG